jgi:hypothetical protein
VTFICRSLADNLVSLYASIDFLVFYDIKKSDIPAAEGGGAGITTRLKLIISMLICLHVKPSSAIRTD